MTDNMEREKNAYYPPLVKNKIPSPLDVKKYIRRIIFGFWHTIMPHEIPPDPPRKLPVFERRSKELYDVCNDMYRDSRERISKLEQKALNLLPYVSVLFGLVTFIYAKVNKPLILNIVIIIIIFLLLSSLIISFRCISIKYVKTLHVFDIYRIDNGNVVEEFDLARISSSLLNCAIFNDNVGNNVADMLNMAREYIKLAIILGILSAGIVITYYAQPKNESFTKGVYISKHVGPPLSSRIDSLSNRLARIESGGGIEQLVQIGGLLADLNTRIDSLEAQSMKRDGSKKAGADSLIK